MNWLYNILYGLLAGLADILPVSAPAHTTLLSVLMGQERVAPITRLLVHMGVLGGLYYSSQSQIIRITRAVKLSRIPKRRRKRPLDTRSLMELQMLKAMAVPVIISFFFYSKASALGGNLLVMAAFLFVNGIILYVPQFLPGGNKDARNMSPVESFLMGLGGAVSVLPGVSAVGGATSVGSVCGADRSFGLNMALLMDMMVTAGLTFMDLLGIFSTGLGVDDFLSFLSALLSAAVAFGGVILGITLMRKLAQKTGFGIFSYYNWGMALFTFILYLSI